jgi:hypothetical protein
MPDSLLIVPGWFFLQPQAAEKCGLQTERAPVGKDPLLPGRFVER